MLKPLFLIIFMIALAVGRSSQAQTSRLFEGDDYLGSGMVTDLLQDRWGRMWIATQGGLTRYDSHEFRTYNSSDGLLNNHVTRLAQDNNDIVVGTTMGVQRFSLATLQFQDIRFFSGKQEKIICNINSVLRRHNGDILIATSGLGLFVLKHGSTEARYSSELMYGELTDVKDIQEAEDGTLWMAAANNGVLRIGQNRIAVYLKGRTPMTNVCITRKGMVYACGMNGGIFKFDVNKNNFVVVEGSERLAVNRMTAKADGGILVATDGLGVYQIDDGKLKVEASSFNKISTVIEDRDGNLWAGVSRKGLLLLNKRKNSFDYIGKQSATQNLIGDYCVSAIYHDHNGVLWVGTDGDGLYRIEDGMSRHYTNVPANILCICEDRRGQLYIGSWLGGCGRFDKTTGRYEQLEATAEGDAAHVMSMVVDADDNLWIATNGDGLKCLDLLTNELTRYNALEVAEPNGKENSLTNAWVNELSLSSDGKRLYLAMSSGVGCLDLQSRSFVKTFGRNHLLPSHAANAVCEDEKGQVWVAAADGLYVIDREHRFTKHLTTADGLPDDNIVSLELDNEGQLWLGTLRGLSCYDMARGTCRNFFKADGVQGNEFFKGASCRLNDGHLAFGGVGGVTVFHPQDIDYTLNSICVLLTGMTVGGQEVCTQTYSGWYQVCDTIVSEAKRFDFAYNDNSLTLSFSTKDYACADGLHYEYRIGADTSWQRLPMNVNVLTLSRLSPDVYPVSVRAVTGSIASEALDFIIVVHPAWYASVYAKVVYSLLVFLMIWYYLHRRRRAEQQRLRVQEHIHAAQMQEMEENKLKEKIQVSVIEVRTEEKTSNDEEVRNEVIRQKVDESIEKSALQTPDERLMERMMKVVNTHIADSNLSVEQIAGEVGLSRSHLHRKMKELTGESTSDFVRNVRLKRAAYLLEGGNHSIAEVMYACGFDSPSGFSSRFKKFYGVSPSEYLREHSYRAGSNEKL